VRHSLLSEWEQLCGVCAAAEAFSQAQASGGGQATAVSQALAQAGANNAQQVGLGWHGELGCGKLCWARRCCGCAVPA